MQPFSALLHLLQGYKFKVTKMKKRILLPICALSLLSGCSNYGDFEVGGDTAYDGGTSQSTPAGQDWKGIITAGEWNDLKNWDFWGKLMLDSDYRYSCTFWGYDTDNRAAVKVVDAGGKAIAGVRLELKADGYSWQAITDNKGEASLWLGLDDLSKTIDVREVEVYVEGKLYDAGLDFTHHQDDNLKINEITISEDVKTEDVVDVAFIVDATGSMSDEINFLKSDLVDILENASDYNKTTALRSAAVFYRDQDDDYVTKFQDFTDDAQKTAEYVKKQRAEGGGDYPEAVHTALECALQNLSWNENAKSRIAFLILDAPAHSDEQVKESLRKSVRLFAENGISIIGVAASGANENTEFMLRLLAIATGGTFTFLTDDSGVGEEHLKPTVGQYQVEHLNDLMKRLIKERME